MTTSWPAPTTNGGAPPVRRPNPSGVVVALVTHEDALVAIGYDAVGTRAAIHRQRWIEGEAALEAERIVKEVAVEGATVLCVGSDVRLDLALDVARVADRDHPEVTVILVAKPTTNLWRDALLAGVRDVVDSTYIDTELEPALRRALDRTVRAREQRTASPVEVGPSGRIIAVLSPKGGSGKTMVAANLAAVLARAGQGSVVLVDLDVQFGDSASALGLIPEHTIGQLVTSPTIDSTTLKVYLTQHEPSGAFVLCGAMSPEEGEGVTDQHAGRILELLARDFAYVVVDTAAGLDERTLATLELADDVVLVASMDVSSIRSLGKEVSALERLGLVGTKRHFVLNRADARVGIDVADVEAALGMEVIAQVPSSRSVPLSMNQGRPIVLDEPSSAVAQEIVKLSARFIDAPSATDGSGLKGRFGRRRK
ncbi:MAG: CpaE family protein [Acidimicrobiia bacterium]